MNLQQFINSIGGFDCLRYLARILGNIPGIRRGDDDGAVIGQIGDTTEIGQISSNFVDSFNETIATNTTQTDEIGQIASNFVDSFNETIATNTTQTDTDIDASDNSVITDNSTNISNRFSTTNVTNIADFIEDSNLLDTFMDIETVAAEGGRTGNFNDADEGDNLITLQPEDAQGGGYRAFDGNDRIAGTTGRDVANGNKGNDELLGGGGEDFLRGGQDADVLDGNAGGDIVNGNKGDDIVRGGGGDDVVRGGADNDVLYGNEGNDVLLGDRGFDICYGGEGADDFILNPSVDNTENAGQADWIGDFNAADGDRIGLAGVEYVEQISAGSVDVNQDGIGDTALVGSNNDILGVVLGINASEFNVQDSMFVASAQETTINMIG